MKFHLSFKRFLFYLSITISFCSCNEDLIPEGPNGEPAVVIEKVNILDKGAEFKAFIYDNGKEIEEYGFVWECEELSIENYTFVLGNKLKKNDCSFKIDGCIYKNHNYITYLYVKYDGKTICSNSISYEGKELYPISTSNIFPKSAKIGETVTLTGGGFIPGVPLIVHVAGVKAEVLNIGFDEITFIIPSVTPQTLAVVEIWRRNNDEWRITGDIRITE